MIFIETGFDSFIKLDQRQISKHCTGKMALPQHKLLLHVTLQVGYSKIETAVSKITL